MLARNDETSPLATCQPLPVIFFKGVSSKTTAGLGFAAGLAPPHHCCIHSQSNASSKTHLRPGVYLSCFFYRLTYVVIGGSNFGESGSENWLPILYEVGCAWLTSLSLIFQAFIVFKVYGVPLFQHLLQVIFCRAIQTGIGTSKPQFSMVVYVLKSILSSPVTT